MAKRKAKQQQAAAVAKPGAMAKEVRITLRGKEYRLICNYRALQMAEMKLAAEGHNVNMLQQLRWEAVGALRLPFLFYGMLVTKHPEITLEAVRDLITLRTHDAVVAAAAEAYIEGMAEAQREEEAAARPTGQPSGEQRPPIG